MTTASPLHVQLDLQTTGLMLALMRGMKTLIALDGSPEAECALQTAAHLLSPVDRNIELLCVAPPAGRRPKGEPHRSYDRRIVAEANRILERARADLPPGAGPLTLSAEIGSPAVVIVEKGRERDLTVVGAKGAGTPGEPGLGPVASRVLEHAAGAVLIARELNHKRDGWRVLVAVDGSGASRRAIEAMQSLFDLDAAEVCLMHVAETPWVHLGLEEDWVTASEEEQDRGEAGRFEKELTREGEEAIEQARTMLRRSRYSISTHAVQGIPADEILSEAERGGYDLIVLGSTGSRDLKHRMLGSVSTKVAWNANCPVLVVKEPEETA